MKRMHAYKAAIDQGNEENVSVGTFCYPILMAVDIILYDATLVPVGKDQKQHVEFARDIAHKFNHTYGETFVLPEPMIDTATATIPGIDGRKMSKSYNNFIGLFEDLESVIKKIKKISTSPIPVSEPKNPDECNLYAITTLVLDEAEDAALRERYTAGGLSYKDVKDLLIEKMTALLTPIHEQREQWSDAQIADILATGAATVRPIAEQKIADVYRMVGYRS